MSKNRLIFKTKKQRYFIGILVCLIACLFITSVHAERTYTQFEIGDSRKLDWIWPVPASLTISQPYKPNEHGGIDIGNCNGCEVRAAKAGTVITVYTGCTNYNGLGIRTCIENGCQPHKNNSKELNINEYTNGYCNYGFGNGVIIDHGDGTKSAYGHMRDSIQVSANTWVEAGTLLGYVGSYGQSVAPHLHFEIRRSDNGNIVYNCNPVQQDDEKGVLYNTTKTYLLNMVHGNGRINGVTDSQRAYYGQKIQMTALPNDGYSFLKWSATAGGTFSDSGSATTTFTMPDADCTVTCEFLRNPLVNAISWSNLSCTPVENNFSLSSKMIIEYGIVPFSSKEPTVMLLVSPDINAVSGASFVNHNGTYHYSFKVTDLTGNETRLVRMFSQQNVLSCLKNDSGEPIGISPGINYYYKWICSLNSKQIESSIECASTYKPSSYWKDLSTDNPTYRGFSGWVYYPQSLNLQEVGCFVSKNQQKVMAATKENHRDVALRYEIVGGNAPHDTLPNNEFRTVVNYSGNTFGTANDGIIINSFEPGVTYYYKFYSVTTDGKISFSETKSYVPAGTAATYQVSITSDAGGKITNGTSGSYAAGNDVAIAAAAEPGYVFDGWTSTGGTLVNAANSFTSIITSAIQTTITAHFKKADYQLKVQSSDHCTVDTSVNGSTYHYGDTVTIKATPDAGYTFTGWVSNNGGSFGNAQSTTTTFVMPAGNVTLVPVVEQLPSGTLQIIEYLNSVPLDKNAVSCGTVNLKINNVLYQSITGSFSKSFTVGTTYEIIPVSTSSGIKYDGVLSGSLKGTITAQGCTVGLNYSSGDWIYANTLPSDVAADASHYIIEYKTIKSQVSVNSPGNGWKQGSVYSNTYVDSGTAYEDIRELPLSNTRVLKGYYYYHWCTRAAGVSNNYDMPVNYSYTTDKYIHKDRISDNNLQFIEVVRTVKDNVDPSITAYVLRWKGGAEVACKGGETCTNDTHNYGSKYWYKMNIYQNKVLEVKYNWTYETDWSSVKPEKYTNIRYKRAPVEVKVNKLTFAKTRDTVSVRNSYTVAATISPTNATNKQLIWSSNDPSIATVQNGTVTPLKPGTVEITAKTSDGSKLSASITLTINPVLSESIKLSDSSIVMNKGERRALPQYTLTPTDTTNKNVVWESTNPSILSVKNGYIYAESEGLCTLKAVAQDGACWTECNVKVLFSDQWIYPENNILPSEYSDPKFYEIEYRMTYQKNSVQSPGTGWTKGKLVSSAYVNVGSVYEDCHELAVSPTRELVGYYYYHWCTRAANANSYVNYAYTDKYFHKDRISDNNLQFIRVEATLKDNVDPTITGYKLRWDGGAQVACKGGETCTGDSHGYGAIIWYKMNRYQDKQLQETYQWTKTIGWTSQRETGDGLVLTEVRYRPRYIPVTKIFLDTNTIEVNLIHKECWILPNIEPIQATCKEVVWSSSDTSIATVQAGQVTLHQPGTVTITCTSVDNPQILDTCKVTVLPILTESIKLSSSKLEVLVSEKTAQLTATVSPNTISTPGLSWSSSNSDVAIVDSNGKITICGIGSCTITCQANDASKVTAQCSLTVKPILVSGIILSTSEITVPVTEWQYTLDAVVLPENATNPSVTWTSSDNSVASVDNGIVTLLKPGTVTITCTAKDGGGAKATCKLTVDVKPINEIIFDTPVVEVSCNESQKALSANIIPVDATEQVLWISSNEQVATVNNGMVEIQGPGLAEITCTAMRQSQVYATCAVIVKGDNVLTMPENLTAIDSNAFDGSSFDTLVLNNHIQTISSGAFANCNDLCLAYMPNSVSAIADDAFINCANLAFVCEDNNYAAYYAITHNIPVVIR